MAEVTIADVNGIAKRVYDKMGIKDLRPVSAIYQKRIGWEDGSREVGESYRISVALRPPNGFTYPGQQTSATGATAMKVARPMIIKQAEIIPFEMDLREQVIYAALSRAAKKGEGAFAQLYSELFKGMKLSASNRLEASIVLGQHTLGVVDSITDLTGQVMKIVFTAATWRPGLWWAVGEGCTLDSFTSTSKNNASGPLILKSVITADRAITVTFTGTAADEVDAGDTVWFEGAWDGTTNYEMPGLISQSGVVSGDSLGLSTDTYGNWKGNTYDVGGPMSHDILEDMLAQLRDRGASGKLTVGVPNKTHSELISELRALRIIDSSYNPEKGKSGFKAIEYVSPDVGSVEIINHPFLAWGEVLINELDSVARVGSSDLTFGLPGSDGKELFRLVDGYNAAEIQLLSDQAVINKAPNRSMYGTGVTHT